MPGRRKCFIRFSIKHQLFWSFINSSDKVTWFLIIWIAKTFSFLKVAMDEFLFRTAFFFREKTSHSSSFKQSLVVCTVRSFSWPLFRAKERMKLAWGKKKKTYSYSPLPWRFDNNNFHIVWSLQKAKSINILARALVVVEFAYFQMLVWSEFSFALRREE